MNRPPSGPTFWRLGGLTGWRGRTASHDGVAVSDAHGLRLAAVPGGAGSLTSGDGSLGGLTLPCGFTFDGELALLLIDHDVVKRYDGETQTFVDLSEVGGEGDEPRRFHDARSIAVARNWLYVADAGNERVQVFDLRTLALVEILTFEDWQPVDVTTWRGTVFILDQRRGRVFRDAPYGRLELQFERADRAGAWSRIAVDRDGVLYFLNATSGMLEQRDPQAPPIDDAGAIADRFDVPPIALDDQGRFRLAPSLAIVCGRSVPSGDDAPPPPNGDERSVPPTAQGDWLLYVVDRSARRVNVYADGGRHLRHSFGACIEWVPADVAACGGVAFILDEEHQTVYRHSAGRESLRLLVTDATRRWSRIACDGTAVYVWEPGAANVQQFDCNGRRAGNRPYRRVASLFDAGRPAPPPPVDAHLFFDRSGKRVAAPDPSEPSGTRVYKAGGTWQSKPLNSDVYRCQWHRIELALAGFPPGSSVSVATCAHEQAEDVGDPTKARFVDAQTIVAAIGEEQCRFDFLVQSGPGQYLSIRITLHGDGFATPAVDSMKVHYPRESYLQYLPATYSADDESRVFLERFLAIFQTEWDEIDRSIDEIERFFDPDAVPEGPFMDYLAAQWLALPLEGSWDAKQKRRLLSAAPKIYPHRGQVAGLRDFLAVYLANMSGLETDDVRALGFPAIVEGFRERRHLIASAGDAATLGEGGAPLWSASVKRRLQLGVFAREGDVALVSTGDPEHDVFAHYAHRFSVTVPAPWVRDAAAEGMLRRAIEAEKPAQTQYELCLIEPRFRLGAQSTVGIDTTIGASPSLRLGCACGGRAPSAPPAGRLGYDSVLSSDPGKDQGLA